MSLGQDLLVTARQLAKARPSKPRQADLRRAVSTSYYAAFHVLAQDCADRLVGTSPQRSDAAWRQTYRALDHGPAKKACEQAPNLGFPRTLIAFAEAFIDLQEERHRADYDPWARYSRAQALDYVNLAQQAIRDLRSAAHSDRKALAVLLLMRRR